MEEDDGEVEEVDRDGDDHSTCCNKLGRIVVQVLRIFVQMMERRMMGMWRRLMVMKTILLQ